MQRSATSGRSSIPVFQNFLLYSDSLNNASWSLLNATVSFNQVAHPLTGATTVDLISDAVGVGLSYRVQQIPSPALTARTHTFSSIVKANGTQWIILTVNGGAKGAWFDLTNGVVGTVSSGCTSAISAITGQSGWYRVSITFTATPADSRVALYPTSGDNISTYNGDGTRKFYSCSRRVVAANWPGAECPTTTTAVNTGGIRNTSTGRAAVSTSRIALQNFAGVSGAVLYFDPAHGVAFDGSNNIIQWTDSAQNLRARPPSAAATPTYSASGFGTGLPGVIFDGTNDQLDFTSNGALTDVKNWTIYLVVKASSLTGVRYILSIGGNAGGYSPAINSGAAGKREIVGKSVGVCSDGSATTNSEIWCISRDNAGTASFSMSVNGVAQSLDVPTTSVTALTSLNYLGSRASANFYAGLIGHVLLYATEHSAGTKNTIITALNSIYGIY